MSSQESLVRVRGVSKHFRRGSEIVHVLERFLGEPLFLERLRGRLAIVEPNRVRFRPPLD